MTGGDSSSLAGGIDWLLCLLLIFTCGSFASSVGGEEPAEHQLKAAFLYNFTQFVDWPAAAFSSIDAPFAVAVIGADPFEGGLERIMEGKSVRGRRIVVRHFGSLEELGTCHLLYVSRSEDELLPALFQQLAGKSVLTVGETDGFPWAGGTIRFFIQENKIRFEISPASAERARLKISSKLMKLARIFRR